MYRKKHSVSGVQSYTWFWASTGDLGAYPTWIREDYCMLLGYFQNEAGNQSLVYLEASVVIHMKHTTESQ